MDLGVMGWLLFMIWNIFYILMNESQPDNSDGDEFEGLTIEKVEQLKRSQLQIKSTFDWLKSR